MPADAFPWWLQEPPDPEAQPDVTPADDDEPDWESVAEAHQEEPPIEAIEARYEAQHLGLD